MKDLFRLIRPTFVITLLLLCICDYSFAQEDNSKHDEVCKKKKSIVIDLIPTTDTIPGRCSDSTLVEMLFNELKSGKIGAYLVDDTNFINKLSLSQLEGPPPVCIMDTIGIIDPETGEEYSYAPKRGLDFYGCHKYRILEQVTTNHRTQKINLHIIGITPMRDVYRDDQTYVGRVGMALFGLMDKK